MSPTLTNQVPSQLELDELVREVERYLAAVEAFRAEGCEPVWATDEAH